MEYKYDEGKYDEGKYDEGKYDEETERAIAMSLESSPISKLNYASNKDTLFIGTRRDNGFKFYVKANKANNDYVDYAIITPNAPVFMRLSKLNRIFVGATLIERYDNCHICMSKNNDTSIIVCKNNHMFHRFCICGYIKSLKDSFNYMHTTTVSDRNGDPVDISEAQTMNVADGCPICKTNILDTVKTDCIIDAGDEKDIQDLYGGESRKPNQEKTNQEKTNQEKTNQEETNQEEEDAKDNYIIRKSYNINVLYYL